MALRLTVDPSDRAKILLAAFRRREREAANLFADAIRRGEGLAVAGEVDMALAWKAAIRAAGRLTGLSNASRQVFLDFWVQHGDALRQEAGADHELLAALRACLPPYRGPGRVLYRGEAARNRRRRTYGSSWSSDRRVAEAFAEGGAHNYEGGTVLLVADVPAEAIVAAAPRSTGEREFIVDRRWLKAGSVRVLRRIQQRAPGL
jgi:hypothetical protein